MAIVRPALVCLLLLGSPPEACLPLQQAPPAAPALRDAQTLGWRVGVVGVTNAAFQQNVELAAALGLKFVEGDYRQRAGWGITGNLGPSLDAAGRKALLDKLAEAGIGMPVYFASFPREEPGSRAVFEFARQFGVETIVAQPDPDALDLIEKLALEHGINVALRSTLRGQAPELSDPAALLALVAKRGPRIGVCGDMARWMLSGIRPLDALRLLGPRLLTVHVHDLSEVGPGGREVAWGTGAAALEDVIKEAYRLELRPALWTVEAPASGADPAAETARSLEFFDRTIQPLASYQRDYVSRTKGVRRLAEPSAEERRLIEAALPEKAPAAPKKPRKLLIVDTNLGRGGHPSIPYANLAVEWMGKRTGAFETVVSHDTSMLEPDKLKQFDALYLNNTAGELFDTPDKKDGLVAFLREGGGLLGNHATTITSSSWPEFGEILGARGASHRMTDEKVAVKLDDPLSPLNAAFGGPFEFSDEIFRFEPPYSRQKVHVLMSIDVAKTDLNQGRCFGKCTREDNDYAIAWIRAYGKGRVFYSTFGHSPSVFWDARILGHWLGAIQYVLGDLDPAPPAADLILRRMASYQYGGSRAAAGEMEGLIASASGDETRLRSIEKGLIDFLASGASVAGKDLACRYLSLVGSEAAVAPLARLLADTDLSGIALYALERIPGAAADQAMRDALRGASGKPQIGLINSLGARKDLSAVALLAPLSRQFDAEVAAAAISALGQISGTAAATALAVARKTSPPALENVALESSLACADRLAETGDRKGAESIYLELAGARQAETIRIGALTGMAHIGSRNALPLLQKAIRGSGPRVRAAAIDILSGMPGPDVTALLAGELAGQPPESRVRLLYALGRRPEAPAREALLASAGAAEEPVRIASLDGLGNIGSAADVLLFAGRAAASQGAEQSAARRSLYRLRHPDADRAVLAGFAGAEPKVKLELIQACAERKIVDAVPSLFEAARDSDADIRSSAFRALRATAEPSHLARLLDLMNSAADPSDRREAAGTVAAVTARAPSEVSAELAARYASAGPGLRVALLEAMAQAGANDLLPTVRGALKEENPEVRRAAILAAGAWPRPDPLSDLFIAAGVDSSPAYRVLALRGALRLLAMPSQRPVAESAALLEQAMRLAAQPGEKRAVLALVPAFPHPLTLALAEAALKDEAIAGEARIAVDRVRKALESSK